MEKMSLWQINAEIENLLSTMVDEETGEIDEEAVAALEQLDLDRSEKIENIACYIKSLNAYAASLKAEKDALASRQKSAENKADRLKSYLQASLNGEKYRSAKADISYRTSTKCVIDEEQCKQWLENNNHSECVKYEASVRKDEVKKLLKDGINVQGAYLEQNTSMTIK